MTISRTLFSASFWVLGLAACGGRTGDDIAQHQPGTGPGGTSSSAGGSSNGGKAAGGSATGGTSSAGSPAVGGTAGIGGSFLGGGGKSGSGNAGTSSAGTSSGGTPSGGTGGTGAGGTDACCDKVSCPAGGECVQGKCLAPPPSPGCWTDADCPKDGSTCQGAHVCGCLADCTDDDAPGTCVPQAEKCCTLDSDCQGGFECAAGACVGKVPFPGCWTDHDCMGGSCVGAVLCPCGAACNGFTSPGMCQFVGQGGFGGTGGTGGASGCCDAGGTCNDPNAECVNGVCLPHPVNGCWSDLDCQFPGPGTYHCEGAAVCPCNAECIQPNKMGVCVQGATPCPVSEPAPGTPCNGPSQLCEYGSDLQVECRDRAMCVNGVWQRLQIDCAALPGPGVDGCPTNAMVNGQACKSNQLVCDMGGGVLCGCGLCLGGPCMMNATWKCLPAPSGACPSIAPELGQACNVDPSVSCSYGFCGTKTGTTRGCVAGVWTDLGEFCPE